MIRAAGAGVVHQGDVAEHGVLGPAQLRQLAEGEHTHKGVRGIGPAIGFVHAVQIWCWRFSAWCIWWQGCHG